MRLILIFAILIFRSIFANSLEIVRDAEIENALYKIVEPLSRFTNQKNLRFFLINSPEIGVFTIKSNIFVNLGTFMASQNSDVLYYMLTHELAHVTLGHTKGFFDLNLNEKDLWDENLSKNPEIPKNIFSQKDELSAESKTIEILERSMRDLSGMRSSAFYLANVKNQLNYLTIHPVFNAKFDMIERAYYYMIDKENKTRPEENELYFLRSRIKVLAFYDKKFSFTIFSDPESKEIDSNIITNMLFFTSYYRIFEYIRKQHYIFAQKEFLSISNNIFSKDLYLSELKALIEYKLGDSNSMQKFLLNIKNVANREIIYPKYAKMLINSSDLSDVNLGLEMLNKLSKKTQNRLDIFKLKAEGYQKISDTYSYLYCMAEISLFSNNYQATKEYIMQAKNFIQSPNYNKYNQRLDELLGISTLKLM